MKQSLITLFIQMFDVEVANAGNKVSHQVRVDGMAILP